MRASLITALLLTAPAVWSQEAGQSAGAVVAPDDLIARCIEASDGEAAGLTQLEGPCPGIEHALVESGYAAFVSEAELEQLTSYSLDDLQQLATRYRKAPSDRSADAAVEKLSPILNSLQQEQQVERPQTWFERFRRWLRTFFQRQQQDQDSWLGRWLRDVSVPEKVTMMILYGLVVLVIVIAIVVVVNEVRAAGLLKGGRRRRGPLQDLASASSSIAHLTIADLDRVPLNERPSVLLRVLTATLMRTGRLRTEKSLTHRELGARAAFDAADQRQCFERVAMLGERLLYGGRQVAAEEIDSVMAAGRALDGQLSTPRVAS